MHDKLNKITNRIIERSRHSRAEYLSRMALQKEQLPPTKGHSCGNLAHTVAALKADDKASILGRKAPNIGIVSAYNDMLSAHKPYEDYARHIRCLDCNANCLGHDLYLRTKSAEDAI